MRSHMQHVFTLTWGLEVGTVRLKHVWLIESRPTKNARGPAASGFWHFSLKTFQKYFSHCSCTVYAICWIQDKTHPINFRGQTNITRWGSHYQGQKHNFSAHVRGKQTNPQVNLRLCRSNLTRHTHSSLSVRVIPEKFLPIHEADTFD